MADNGRPVTRGPITTRDAPQDVGGVRTRKLSSSSDNAEKTIVVRDRRKPNQYTTDNVIAREWLPILRVGDALFFYSIYLSMANRETESSWGSLRTQAEYLQCGVDLIIRGNKLLEICELIYIDTGDHRTTNEYYILAPPALTPELKKRIYQRLDAIADEETSQNWQSWGKQVRKALDRHRSLPSIWAERRKKRGGRPVRTVRAEKGVREPQPGFQEEGRGAGNRAVEKGACESQAGWLWDTIRVDVAHKQGVCEPQPEQGQLTRDQEQAIEREESLLSLVRAECHRLGVAPTVVDIMIENYSAEHILQQLEWLPFRHPRDAAALLVSAVQGDWEKPAQYSDEVDADLPVRRVGSAETASAPVSLAVRAGLGGNGLTVPGTDLDARDVWAQALEELRLQMTRATFDTWLGGTRVIGVGEGAMSVRVRDEYAAEWLASRWREPIQRTLSGIVGRPMAVHFTGQDSQDLQDSWS